MSAGVWSLFENKPSFGRLTGNSLSFVLLHPRRDGHYNRHHHRVLPPGAEYLLCRHLV